VPSPVSYYSPAISAEAAAQVRLTPTVAVTLGLQLLGDNASIGGNTVVGPQSGHALVGGTGSPQPIPAPQLHLASGPQIFLGPYLGMQFGP
jgi:hypothetical protein